MNKLILGRYFPGESLIHQLDARAKLISGIAFIFIVFIANSWLGYLFLWLFTFFTMLLTSVKLRVYFRGVRPLIWLILFTVMLQLFFTSGGEIYLDWGPVTVSQNGIIRGIFTFSRFVIIVFISTVVTLTTKPIDLTDAINALLSPLNKLKIPVEELSLMLSISLRFVPNLLDETQKVMDAQRARGVEFGEGSLFRQMKTLVPVLLPLFVSSLNRAEEMANVMEARGYQSGKKRSKFRQLHWQKKDTVSVFTIGLVALVLFYMRGMGI
ncbi:MAG: energy-coupling factor transporter transmembrane protein EcfT [Bacillaceae bacterium]|nr:energy-coupling factor transporter transmembrane protein EcfT [Bacillaceae bacterium]